MPQPKRILTFDVETMDAELLYVTPPEEFVRLVGMKLYGNDKIVITTDLDMVKEQILGADLIIGHNMIMFDLPAVFGHRSDVVMQLADRERLLDTFVHAPLAFPCPPEYRNRNGRVVKAPKPEQQQKFYGLDELAFQLGVPGKTADLGELAKEFRVHSEECTTGRVRCTCPAGFGEIPIDDPRFIAYLEGDVLATEAVALKLLKKLKMTAYAKREQRIHTRAAMIKSNGWRVDQPEAEARVAELAARREVILTDLSERYGLPGGAGAPWDTNAGKAAIMAALADHGIKPSDDWPKTPVWDKRAEKREEVRKKRSELEAKVIGWENEIEEGLTEFKEKVRRGWIEKARVELDSPMLPVHFGLSFGGKELIELTKDTPAEEIGQALAELKGQRSLAQLALDSVHSDGMVHPQITLLQRSGRSSFTNPGLTVWTARGPGAVEKRYFIPDDSDQVLLAFDYSNADARVVAALSGDRKYAERFEPGADGHMINAIAAWGEAKVNSDPKHYRQAAKPRGHGWGYRVGARKLAKMFKTNIEDEKVFLDGMNSTFRRVVAWQDRCVAEAHRYGYMTNLWGRRMMVEPGREFTQAPALLGQSGTREIMCDALLKMPYSLIRRIKAWIHDELIFSVLRDEWREYRDQIIDLMKSEFNPPGGQYIAFPVSCGEPAENWFLATHD